MTRIIIADDEESTRERVRTLVSERTDVAIVAECRDGREAIDAFNEHRPDLLFLDIRMPGVDGMNVAEHVGSNSSSVVIFVTAFDEFAVEAFDREAIDYVLKPIEPGRFFKALDRGISRVAATRSHEELTALRIRRSDGAPSKRTRFAVLRSGKQHFVLADSIDWIDAAGNYVRLHVGGETHLVRTTMATLEDELNPDVFLRIHRSVIINRSRIASACPAGHGEYELTLTDRTILRSGRTYSRRLRLVLKD